MYKGKHMLSVTPKRVIKPFALLVSLILLVAGLTSTTIAFLADSPEPVTNNFQYDKVACSVNEEFEDGMVVKRNVSVQNTGTTEAYIRAKVVATWQDEEGNIAAEVPVVGEEMDYTITYNDKDWFKGDDGYWYCKNKIAAGGETPILIDTCRVKKSGPANCHLVVEILADAIQANPSNAVTEAWGVTVSNGQITE